MTQLKEPTGIFSGSIKDLMAWREKAKNGILKFNYSDMEHIMLIHDITLSECLKLLRKYQSKIPESDPRRSEFNEAVDDLIQAIIFREVFQRELSVARQRAADLELKMIILNDENKKLRKQNEELIKGF